MKNRQKLNVLNVDSVNIGSWLLINGSIQSNNWSMKVCNKTKRHNLITLILYLIFAN